MSEGKQLAEEIFKEVYKGMEQGGDKKALGTSQEQGMDYQLKKKLQGKVEQMLEVIAQLFKKDINSTITREELRKYYYNTKQHYEWPEFNFDENYANKIFEILGFENSTEIPIREFIKTTAILEVKLQVNKNRSMNTYENLKAKAEKCEQQIQKYEELYQNKPQEINLGVVLCEVTDIQNPTGGSYAVQLDIEDQNQISDAGEYDNGNVIINQNFRFTLKQRKQELKVSLISLGRLNKTIGEFFISLEELSPTQETVEEVYAFYKNGRNMDEETGRIRISIHYVYDTLEFFNEQLRKFSYQINELSKVLSKIYVFDQFYDKPFGIWMIGELRCIRNVDVTGSNEFMQPINEENIFGRSTHLKPKNDFRESQNPFPKEKIKEKNLPLERSSVLEKLEGLRKSMPFDKIKNINFGQKNKGSLALILVFGLISLFNNNCRCDLVNLVAFAVVALIFLFGDFEKRGLVLHNYMLYSISACEAFDLVWLFLTFGACFGNPNPNPDSAWQKLTYFLSVINVLVKGLLGLSIYNSKKKLQNSNPPLLS